MLFAILVAAAAKVTVGIKVSFPTRYAWPMTFAATDVSTPAVRVLICNWFSRWAAVRTWPGSAEQRRILQFQVMMEALVSRSSSFFGCAVAR